MQRLMVAGGCDFGDSREGELVALVNGCRLCVRHWLAAGCPWPRRAATAAEAHEAEKRTRERMLARGGTDRYAVRTGKT